MMINVAIVYDKALSYNIVFHIEVWGAFISAHPSLKVDHAISQHDGADKFYLCQGLISLPHMSTNTMKTILRRHPSVEYKCVDKTIVRQVDAFFLIIPG